MALYRITEQDVHMIMENVVRRVLKEFYDQKNLKELWIEAINMIGAKNFVSILDDGYDMSDIYDTLIQKTGISEEDLDAIGYDEFADLMLDHLNPEEQYNILSYVGDETGAFTVDDVVMSNTIDIDSIDDIDSIGNEISSEDEVEVDDEEYEDPEFEDID